MLNIFDAHFHIIDYGFPLTANQGYLPQQFTRNDYMLRTKNLPVKGGALVSASFQGFDQTYLLAALQALGTAFVGVTQLPFTVSDAALIKLDASGVRAVRVNLFRGHKIDMPELTQFARRIYELVQWHIELYLNAAQLNALMPALLQFPALSIDHLGLSDTALPALLKLVKQGVKIKATGFGRLAMHIPHVLTEIAAIDPAALLFGTDLPSTRAARPFAERDIHLIRKALGDELAEKVLYTNAVCFYRPKRILCN
ncbi:amidohydrolase family protein [Legionella septentrionalis]|uniref:amidohydrolase family protein n=1 Tax=Legionella septentrionalis TaxID=2498109 RepID=UPI000F8ED634|nr:amidohydrolase family protein [Legionella septentrionalis]RUQ97320.1 2-pyrone-4,6-dicarboxylate hydrolase [Legionella septentrionalis]